MTQLHFFDAGPTVASVSVSAAHTAPARPGAPGPRFGVRTLEDMTVESLSRLPSAATPPAAPQRGPRPLGLRRASEPLHDAAAALLAELRAAGPAGIDFAHNTDVTRHLAMRDLERAGHIEPGTGPDDHVIRLARRRHP